VGQVLADANMALGGCELPSYETSRMTSGLIKRMSKNITAAPDQNIKRPNAPLLTSCKN